MFSKEVAEIFGLKKDTEESKTKKVAMVLTYEKRQRVEC